MSTSSHMWWRFLSCASGLPFLGTSLRGCSFRLAFSVGLLSELQTLAYWFCLLHLVHVRPYAGQSPLLCSPPPQYLQFVTVNPVVAPTSFSRFAVKHVFAVTHVLYLHRCYFIDSTYLHSLPRIEFRFAQ